MIYIKFLKVMQGCISNIYTPLISLVCPLVSPIILLNLKWKEKKSETTPDFDYRRWEGPECEWSQVSEAKRRHCLWWHYWAHAAVTPATGCFDQNVLSLVKEFEECHFVHDRKPDTSDPV